MSEASTETAVTKVAGGLPAVPDEGTWGAENISSQDILIPKILLMQGLSKFVMDEDSTARAGEFRDSLTGDLLGNKEKPLEVVAFTSFKVWIEQEEKGSELEYLRTIPITAENEGWDLVEEVDGKIIRRDRCHNFYVLIPDQVKEGSSFPYVISFRRSTYQTGKKLSTYATKLAMRNQPLASQVFEISTVKTENDKGVFYITDIKPSRVAEKEEKAAAWQWYQTLSKSSDNVKVDDSDLAVEAKAATKKKKSSSSAVVDGDNIPF